MPAVDREERALVRELSALVDDYAALHRRAVQDMARSQRELADTREALGHVVHDLRTPLTTVLGLSELLLDADLSATDRGMVDRIDGAAEVMRQLTQDLLDVLSIGVTRTARDPVDLHDLVDSIIARRRLVDSGDGVRFEVVHEPKDRDGAFVIGDRIKLVRLLDNLINNAVKYSPTDGVVRVVVADQNDGRDPSSHVGSQIVVTDQGPGIPQAEQAKIFDPFQRAAGASHIEGIGLGLAIVAEIVKAHGGSVSVRSRPGEGASFTVHLPSTRHPTPSAPAGL